MRAPASRWIVDRSRDLALIVAAPVWIAPLMFLAAAAAGDRAINTAVMAFGSLGHQLPGMMRAYGDRALFARFRRRFILAPLALGAVCIGFQRGGLHALMLIAFIWGVWHALMQSYGFARIYAAKSCDGAAFDRVRARLDLALLAAWFLAAVLLSPLRLGYLIDMAATCGLPFPSAGEVAAVKWTAATLAGAATVAWLGKLALDWRTSPPRLLPVVTLITSIAFWWFANVRVRHPLLSAPLFEVFHDLQYLLIVWAFNQRRGQMAPAELRPILRALFRPSVLSAVFYVAAVLAYGALGLYQPSGTLSDVWNGLLAASQLLHFYYDGFIWKVHEPATGAPLGVAASTTSAAKSSTGIAHLALWGGLAASLLLLGVGEAQRGRSLRQRIPTLVELVPDNGLYHFYDAEIHWERGEHEPALAGFRRSLALDPDYLPSRNNLALSLTELADHAADAGDRQRVIKLMSELRELRPMLEGDVAVHADEELARYSN